MRRRSRSERQSNQQARHERGRANTQNDYASHRCHLFNPPAHVVGDPENKAAEDLEREGAAALFTARGAPPPLARAPALEDSLSSRGPQALSALRCSQRSDSISARLASRTDGATCRVYNRVQARTAPVAKRSHKVMPAPPVCAGAAPSPVRLPRSPVRLRDPRRSAHTAAGPACSRRPRAADPPSGSARRPIFSSRPSAR